MGSKKERKRESYWKMLENNSGKNRKIVDPVRYNS